MAPFDLDLLRDDRADDAPVPAIAATAVSDEAPADADMATARALVRDDVDDDVDDIGVGDANDDDDDDDDDDDESEDDDESALDGSGSLWRGSRLTRCATEVSACARTAAPSAKLRPSLSASRSAHSSMASRMAAVSSSSSTSTENTVSRCGRLQSSGSASLSSCSVSASLLCHD